MIEADPCTALFQIMSPFAIGGAIAVVSARYSNSDVD
jgi:hypothetical protein